MKYYGKNLGEKKQKSLFRGEDLEWTLPEDHFLVKLNKVVPWEKLVDVAENIREKGSDIIIRGKQKLLQEIRGFDLQRKKGKKKIMKMRKKLLRKCKKLEEKISDFIKK